MQISGVTDRGQVCELLFPDKLNVKTGPHLAYISPFGILLVFTKLLFAFLGVFAADFGL